jgi:glyoxylase-like metal-dependent hydrolase (beta-lactamase superfamily II)
MGGQSLIPACRGRQAATEVKMDAPTMFESQPAAPSTDALISYFPIPGYGLIPINAFLIRAAQPVLVDTGLGALQEPFMRNLGALIAIEDLRWLCLTHMDADHIGNLVRVLSAAPKARVVTTFLGMGKMLLRQLPVDRVFLLNPGQSLEAGDRQLVCITPPAYDAPETIGFFDTKTQAYFCADCFGALMKEPAPAAADIPAADLRDGLVTWATVDFPWLHLVAEDKFRGSLDAIRNLKPSVVLSHHLPPAVGMTETLLKHLDSVRTAKPFVGPDQAALEQMSAGG